jgi:hypothetical protein
VTIVLLASVGPWKFSSITKRTLQNRVETILNGRQLTLSDSDSPLNELDTEKKLEIRETLDYLTNTYGKASIQTFFKDRIENESVYTIFAYLKLNKLKPTESNNDSKWFSFYNNAGSVLLDLKDYQSCIMFSFDEYRQKEEDDKNIQIQLDSSLLKIQIISDNCSVSFPIKDIALKQISHSGKPETAILLEAFDNEGILEEAPARRYLLAITRMTGNYYIAKDSLSMNHLEGMLLYK